ncbi:MAG: AAA family ATPase [Gemmatimonadales bacterium]
MRLHRIRLHNFRQHAETELLLSEGLTGIVGPNGAGKSTLLEAVAWAMYGTPAARGNRDSIRRRNAPPRSRVEVELEFGLGAHRYRVVRSLQSAALYLDQEPAPIVNSAGAVTERVTRLLGMTREEFFNTYFTGQKELAIMGSMSGPERARFLSRVLGYERLAAAQVRLKEGRTALKASLATAESGLPDPAALKKDEEDAERRLALCRHAVRESRKAYEQTGVELEALVPRWEAIQKQREEVLSIDTDLKVAQHRAEEARRGFQQLDRELAEALAAKGKCNQIAPHLAEVEPLLAERERLDGEAQAFAGRKALLVQVADLKTRDAALGEKLAKLVSDAALDEASAALDLAQAAEQAAARVVEEHHGVWVREKQDAETKRQGLLERHEELTEQLRRLRETGPTVVCPTCGKPLGKEYEAVLDDLDAQRDDVLLRGKFYRQRIDQLTSEPPELAEARKTLQAAESALTKRTAQVARWTAERQERQEIEGERARGAERLRTLEADLAHTPTSYDEAAHQRVKARLAALQPLRDQFTRLSVAADRAAELVPKAAEAEQELSKAEARVLELRERLAELGWSSERYEGLRAEHARVSEAGRLAEVRMVRADAELAAAVEHREAVAARRADRDRRAAAIAELRGELLLNQELDRAFTDLRNDLNATIRPDLSDAASVLIRDLTNGRYSDLELSEDYVPVIVDDGEPKTVISGGEEDVANLALRLAISQMIAERAGQPFSLLVLDEIFGSLDEERRSAVVDLLRGLADRFPQVVLITHIESVRDGFDRVIRINYDPERGIATAQEERISAEPPHAAA